MNREAASIESAIEAFIPNLFRGPVQNSVFFATVLRHGTAWLGGTTSVELRVINPQILFSVEQNAEGCDATTASIMYKSRAQKKL